MCLNNLLSFLCFTLVFSFGYVSAQKCGESMFFRPNSTYDTNRHLVLSTLASNVSSRDGFYNVSVGEGAGRIYALGLCMPGTDPKVCSDCIQPASDGLLLKCPNQTDSWDWRADKTLCFVRYSNRSFFNEIDLTPYAAEYNTGFITENITEFIGVWDNFMRDMISAASSSPGLASRRHYAVNVSLPTPGFQRFYALMQCIPGITSANCGTCLQRNVRDYKACCSMNIGGSIRRPVCFFRWDLYPYLYAFDSITSQPPQRPQRAQSPQGAQATTPPLPPPPDGNTISTGIVVAIVISSSVFVALFALGLVAWKRRQSHKKIEYESGDDITGPQPLQFNFKTIEDATDKFAENNKVGQGGFGEVYKGTLPNGTIVAVKRLSRYSGQGAQEFKNEVLVVAKLQHRNLVRLLGFCLEGDEIILVYEFVPNKSLDNFLFDPKKQQPLDWTGRYNIISGICSRDSISSSRFTTHSHTP